ncbi:hypothetical protein CIG19_20005 [Enterobacterales bacterium CwR94]|nr:hypothetical protein CIG19_20005 [Enterobacterales bacterium CwR94]
MINSNKKKIVIMSNHPLYLYGLKHILNESPAFRVLDCCINTDELNYSLSIFKANMVIIDLSQPEGGVNIKETVVKLHKYYPDITLVALGESPCHQLLSMNLRPMVKIYLCKSLPVNDILSGLKWAHNYHSCDVKSNHYADKKCSPNIRTTLLTAREKFILEYIHAGLSVSQVAQRVNRSVKTVSTQKRTAMKKLGITSNHDIYQLDLSEI